MSASLSLLESAKQAVSARIGNVTPALLDNEMRWVLDDFLRNTRVWREVVEVTMVPGQADYALDIEDYEAAVGIIQARYGGFPVSLFIQRASYTQTGAPAWAGLLNDRTLRVYPLPSAGTTGVMEVEVFKTLLPTLHAVPPDELRPYHRAIMDGLLSRMFEMADKPWHNLKAFAVAVANYEAAKADVRIMADRGRAVTSQQVAFPRHGF